jgi:CRISP-associated protein Cas1
MIKRTLYFGNPAYLCKKLEQMIVRLPEVEKNETLPDVFKKEAHASIPIEDIGVVMLDNQQISITHGLIEALLANNVAIISCDSKHLPVGMMLPLAGNTTQTERFKNQIEASEPLRKQLWQQTIRQKIKNQAEVLKRKEKNIANMLHWAEEVKSGDTDNHEARAAAYYWANIFDAKYDFKREREGLPPNNLLNYGYALVRAVIARALVGSGLLTTLGIFHRNRYNAYCLADDMMEPYRPFVDWEVLKIVENGQGIEELNKELKMQLLGIPTLDVIINEQRSPLMIASHQTSASLSQCFEGTVRRIAFPEFPTTE